MWVLGMEPRSCARAIIALNAEPPLHSHRLTLYPHKFQPRSKDLFFQTNSHRNTNGDFILNGLELNNSNALHRKLEDLGGIWEEGERDQNMSYEKFK